MVLVIASLASTASTAKAESSVKLTSPVGGSVSWGIGKSLPLTWETTGEVKKVDFGVSGFYSPVKLGNTGNLSDLAEWCFLAGKFGVSNKNGYSWKLSKKDIFFKANDKPCLYYVFGVLPAGSKAKGADSPSTEFTSINWSADMPKTLDNWSKMLGRGAVENEVKDSSVSLLQITSPNGGKKYKMGESVPITWKNKGDISRVTLTLYGYNDTDLCLTNNISAADIPNTGKYDWMIDQDVLDKDRRLCKYYKVGLNSWQGVEDEDKSDKSFSISGYPSGPVPTASFPPIDVVAGSTITITGTGFLKNNTVQFTNSDNLTFNIPNVPSKDGKTIKVKLPKSLVPGSYTLDVGNSNGSINWNGSSKWVPGFTIVSAK